MSRWLPKSYHDFVRSVWQTFRGVEEKTVRARTIEGHFKADDKSTPNVNEAYKPIKYYLIEEKILNLILQNVAQLPHVLIDPKTKKVIQEVEE